MVWAASMLSFGHAHRWPLVEGAVDMLVAWLQILTELDAPNEARGDRGAADGELITGGWLATA